MRRLGDLLFELSNDDRRRILVSILESPKRLTQISNELGLTLQEASRQLSRLEEVGLEYKDSRGFHYLTPYGELVLRQLRGFEFTSRYDNYWVNHSLAGISSEFVDRIGDLSDSDYFDSALDFLRYTEKLLNDSNEHVFLLVDQFPLNSLSTIVEAIERGVQFKIIEPSDRIVSPDLDSLTSEETSALNRTRHTPLVNQKMLDQINVFMYLSENRCVLAFPNSSGKYDYTGFTATDLSSIKWCTELFDHYWDVAKERTLVSSSISVKREIYDTKDSQDRIVVVGKESPEFDVLAVQDAVDKFDEVILRGTFNFGTSNVMISKSVIVRGEGRENDIPAATIYKKGWSFPFREWDAVFFVNGEKAKVRIENINFTDFNCVCIRGWRARRIHVSNNRMTLWSGYGRGMSLAAFGDIVMPISIESNLDANFVEGVFVEGNYINFRRQGLMGGHLSRGGLEDDPEYRPDLFNHEYYVGIGIVINGMPGVVRIVNNTIMNANSRGISSSSHQLSAKIQIKNNIIESDVYGSYFFSHDEAGAGIVSYSSRDSPGKGFGLEIEANTIKLDKVNYSGIVIIGPTTNLEGSDKLRGGIIRNNSIHLRDGFEGIHVRMCDDFKIENNVFSGQAYYGIKILGQDNPDGIDLRALENIIEDNDFSDLTIRCSDGYSNNHVDGRMFSNSDGKSATAHLWLNEFTSGNSVKVKTSELVIDEGKNNKISFHNR